MMENRWEHDETCWVYEVIFSDLKICGCGDCDGRLLVLKETLNAFPLYGSDHPMRYILRSPLGEWFLCLLTDADLIEHGGTIHGSWLTSKGERVKAILNDKKEFNRFLNGDYMLGMCECMVCQRERTKKN